MKVHTVSIRKAFHIVTVGSFGSKSKTRSTGTDALVNSTGDEGNRRQTHTIANPTKAPMTYAPIMTTSMTQSSFQCLFEM
jgi:hypothetical protein